MKKVFTLAISMAFLSFAYGQSQRTVLVEEGTNASCPPCASQNPDFNTLLQANPNKVVSIKYQAWWPGYDPMYEHNTADVHNRIDYYGIDGVPTSVLDGEIISGSYPGFDTANDGWYDGAPGGYSQEVIDNAYDVPASFDIDIAYTITPDGITVTPTATCTQDVSGNLKFHIAIVENEIDFDTAPGSNGETVFYNVMKKMLPTAAGASMESSYTVGDTYTTTQSWTFANVYDVNQLGVVAFIQNDDTKEVLQAGFNDSEDLQPSGDLDAAALNITGLPDFTCESTVSPTIEIRNNGANNLTQLAIDYTLNDASGTINWTGDLAFYETETVDLGDITFTPDADNTLQVTLSDPNGSTDENSANDMIEETVNLAGLTTLDITVEVLTDYYALETSWDIKNSNGDVVASHQYVGGTDDSFGGGGPDANMVHDHAVMLDPFDCYTFTIYDEYGDGMSYSGGTSTTEYGYRIIDGNGNTVVEDVEASFNFGSATSNAVRTENTLNVNEASINSSLSLYPNPTNDNLNVAFQLKNADNISIDIYNLVGQLVSSKDFGTISSGYTLKTLDVSNLSSGFYMVNINTSDARIVRKITVSK